MDTKKEYSEDDSLDKNTTAAKSDNYGDNGPRQSPEDGYATDSTTGSGYSEAERGVNDNTNSRNPADPQHADNGRIELVNKYNINDKAHSDSSKADFVETVSKFHHAEPGDDITNDSDIQI